MLALAGLSDKPSWLNTFAQLPSDVSPYILLYESTIVHRPSTHTCPNAHPQTLENLNFFPSLFNVHVKAHPQTFKNPN